MNTDMTYCNDDPYECCKTCDRNGAAQYERNKAYWWMTPPSPYLLTAMRICPTYYNKEYECKPMSPSSSQE
jgi:hypothetical protein